MIIFLAPWDFPFIRVSYSPEEFGRSRRFDNNFGQKGNLFENLLRKDQENKKLGVFIKILIHLLQ